MKRNLKPIILSVLFIFFILAADSGHAIDAVASIKRLKGQVEIKRDRTTIAARSGLILNDKDVVITYNKSKVTIIFRDGSEIRLFPNTQFIIEKSEEAKTGARKFLHNFKLKLGSFWGKFTRNRQNTVIKTPTATAGIKGTTVAFSERNGKMSVSLSSGSVSIQNQFESVLLKPGQMAKGITSSEPIHEKIGSLPYKITIRPDQNQFPPLMRGQEKELFFTLQLVDTRSGENVSREGEVYISISTDKIYFPENIRLNKRGYARIKAVIKAFDFGKDKENIIEVFALMDGEGFLDTGSSSTLLSFKPEVEQQHKLKIDAKSGEIQD
jgi:FecR-like protein